MVCQAAGKTRFRALKHENGIAGNATIIIRIIACFQPLQDCQGLTHMDKDFNHRFVAPTWHFDNIEQWNCQRPPDIGQSSFGNFMVFNTFVGNGTMPFPGFAAQKFCQLNSINITSGLASSHKNFLVFDHSGDKTNLIFSSTSPGFLNMNPSNIVRGLRGKNEMADQIREDTDEIDALLYSGSYEVLGEEEASTGHSPFTPCKRRKIENDLANSALADTASSGLAYNCHYNYEMTIPDNIWEEGDEISYVKGGSQLLRESSAGNSKASTKSSRKRAKREKIRKTVKLLRDMLPGGKGKDAVTVLDEAIRYLKSLRLKAKTFSASYF